MWKEFLDYGSIWLSHKTQRLRSITQARPKVKHLPPVPPPQVYSQVATYLSQFTPRQKQQIMLHLFSVNFISAQLTIMTVNPIIGMTGITYTAQEDTPTIEEIVAEYLDYNELDNREEQRALVRSYINTGEVCLLSAPYDTTHFTQRVPSVLIRQTFVDPMNPYKVIGVLLEPYYFDQTYYIYKTITDERRLSQEAKDLRKNWIDGCYFFANYESDDVEEASGWATFPEKLFPKQSSYDTLAWIRKQRRGTPLFFRSSDLFNHLVDTLWQMLDKVKNWNMFNYDFEIATGEDDLDRSLAKVQAWQTQIGTPTYNSAFYHDDKVKMTPVSFPMQSFDLKRVLDMMLQVSGIGANVTPYDLGDQHTTFATAKAQGNPTEQFRVAIQGTTEDMYYTQFVHILKKAEQQGQIPREELQALKELSYKDRKRYGVKVISPEIGNKDLLSRAQAWKTDSETLKLYQEMGLWTVESLAKAGAQLSRQIAEVEIDPLSDEELTALTEPVPEEMLIEKPGLEKPEPELGDVEKIA